MVAEGRPADASPAEQKPTQSVDGLDQRWRGVEVAIWGPRCAVAVSVALGFLAYATLAHFQKFPWVFGDELWYSDAGASLVRGDGLSVRGHSYGFGLLYPLVLAAILWFVRNRETAYDVFKTVNALFFALAAVPIYLLARKILDRWASAAVAAASLAIPSGLYVSVVMTESLSYLVASCALLAMACAFERPTTTRQIAALGSIVVAYGARPQFAALYVAYVVGIAVCAVGRRGRTKTRHSLLEIWPTAASLVLVVVAFFVVVPEVRGSSASGSLGSYSVLWRSYNAPQVAKWTLYHIADLDLYLGVVAFAIAPISCQILLAKARRGSSSARPFLALFITSNAAVILVVAAFASTQFGHGQLHDRYLFYLVPLWLILFALWLQEGLPRPVAATVGGAAAAVGLPLLTPSHLFAGDWQQFFALATPLWAFVAGHTYTIRHIDLRRIISAFSVAVAAATIFIPRRLNWTLPSIVLAIFLLNGLFAWRWTLRLPDRVFENKTRPTWLDRAVGRSGRVTEFWVTSPRCDPTLGFYLSEFFNWSVRRAVYVKNTPDLLPSARVTVANDGRVSLASGAPLFADYVLTPPGVRLQGRLVAVGTDQHLVLWHVAGRVRTKGVASNGVLGKAAPSECTLSR